MATRPPSIDTAQDPGLPQANTTSASENVDPAAYAGRGKIYDFGNNTVVVDTDKQVFINVEEQITNQNFITVQEANANVTTGVTSIVAGNNVTITSTGANGTGQVTINANASGGNGTPGGVNGQVQYNANGAFAGSANLTFNAANGTLATTNVRAQYGFMASAELGNIDVGISGDPLHDAIFNNATDTALNIRSGNTANSANGIFIYTYGSDGNGTGGGEVDVGRNNVKIHGLWSANTANAKTWTFGNTGAITFPDSTVQNTAWTGTVAGANVTGEVGSANFATFSSQADSALTVAGANVTGQVGNAATLNGHAPSTSASANTVVVRDANGSISVNQVLGVISGSNVSGQVAFANVANNVAGANVSGVVANASYATLADTSNIALSVGGANVFGAVNSALFANAAAVANAANSVSVANVVGIGNIATTNLNGNGDQVLSGNGAWVDNSANGVTTVNGSNGAITISAGSGINVVTSSGLITITNTGGNAGNATPAGSNTQVQFNEAGVFGASANLTFNFATNTLSVTNFAASTANIANISVSGNLTANDIDANIAHIPNVVANGTVTANNIGANSAVINQAEFGLVDIQKSNNALHDAIFHKVTDTALNIRSANANVSSGVYIYGYGSDGNGEGAGEVNVLNNSVEVFGLWSANTALQKRWRFTNTGSLEFPDATVQNTAWTGNVPGSNVIGAVSNATFATSAGTVTTAAQPNITSVGNLVSLTVSGVSQLGGVGNVKITGGSNGQVLTTDGAGNLSFTTVNGTPAGANTQLQFNNNGAFGGSANLTWNGNVLSAGNIYVADELSAENGLIIVDTANRIMTQMNWDFTGPVRSGYLQLRAVDTGNSNVSATVGIGIPTTPQFVANGGYNLTLPGNAGSNGQFLQTDGAGNLSWANAGGNTTPGGSNTQIQFNSNGAFGGSTNLTFDNTTNTLTVPYVSAVGNVTTSSLITNDVRGTGNIAMIVRAAVGQDLFLGGGNAAANVSLETNLETSSNITQRGSSSQIFTQGQVYAERGLRTDFDLVVSGNANIGGLNVLANAAPINLGPVTNVKLTGGTNGQVLTTDGAGNLSFTTVSGGNTTPGGANTQVQFNANGAFGGSANFTFSETGGVGGAPAIGVGQRIALVGNPIANTANLLASNSLSITTAGGNITLDPSLNVIMPTVSNVKMPGGTNGQVLTTDGTGNLSFTTVSGGGSSLLNVANVTATPFNVTANTQFLYVTNTTATTINLPEAVVVGSEIIVKDGLGANRVGNAITVSVANGNIDGNATYTINAAYNSVTFVGVGANTYAAI